MPASNISVSDRPHLALKPLAVRSILGVSVHGTSYQDATERVIAWAQDETSRTVCIANVHVIMEGYDDPSYRKILNEADLVTPDGMPLVWGLRWQGVADASRVYGPDLTPVVLAAAEREDIAVGFYGGSPEVLAILLREVSARFPKLRVVFSESPPFRRLSAEEDAAVVRKMDAAGVRILFVGLGCPKQERWMAEHVGQVRAVMLGVGAAFDFLAGCKPQAPDWIQKIGFEWLFRLVVEPKRLWKRYTKHNPRFAFLMLFQLLRKNAPPRLPSS